MFHGSYTDESTPQLVYKNGRCTIAVPHDFFCWNTKELNDAYHAVLSKLATGPFPYSTIDVTKLDLHDINLNEATSKMYVEMLRRFTFLKSLEITGDNCRIYWPRVFSSLFIEAIDAHQSLESVTLKLGYCSSPMPLFQMLEKNEKLKQFDLSGTMVKITPKKVAAITSLIRNNEILEHLNLDFAVMHTNVDGTDALFGYDYSDLQRAITENTTLLSLQLPYNFGIDHFFIRSIMERNKSYKTPFVPEIPEEVIPCPTPFSSIPRPSDFFLGFSAPPSSVDREVSPTKKQRV